VRKHLLVIAILFCATAVCSAGENVAATSAAPKAVSRVTKAVHYRQQGGSVKVAFHGTELLSQASGEAEVKGKKTRIEIEAKLTSLEDATKFGLEYLTYVLWAVSPQGRPVNLGEVILDHGNAHLKAFTDMQTFGMIVTAEPYFAVSQPGNMVVMESSAPAGMAAGQDIDANYELVARGTYSSTNTRIENAIFGIDSRTPLALFEARNALRIAHNALADKYAAAIIGKADQQLKHAEDTYRQHQNRSVVEAAAREAVQTAEEARVMAVKQKAEEEAHAEAAAREAKARADAASEARQRAEADAARAQAEAAKADAIRAKQEAMQAAQEATRQRQAAEQAKAEALAQQQALAVEAEKARRAAQESEQLRQQAERDKQELRARLLQQLNNILATRDSARGLIANMSDVLFRSGSFELLPGARERLAKVSGIVLAYPSLHLEVEGHTDSIGTDAYNLQLSERRAEAVRDYLVQQGISNDTIVARGLGKSAPVATNDTSEGRQQNRRVELVLSGEAIGSGDKNQSASSSTDSQQ